MVPGGVRWRDRLVRVGIQESKSALSGLGPEKGCLQQGLVLCFFALHSLRMTAINYCV